MSKKLISLNLDLQRLQDEGYEVEIRNGYLILHSIPYVNSRCEIAMGMLATDLTLVNDQTQRPGDHQVWFAGEHPCNQDGSILSAISHSTAVQLLCEGLEVNHRFSNKPPEGYPDYFSKMSRYAEIISHQAMAIDQAATPRTFKPIESAEDDSVFLYIDSASSRAGIAGLAKKLAINKLAIVGLGGTGSYILDLIAKTHAREIHLFDGDQFQQHNAFRAPGAVSFERLNMKLSKVAHYAELYGHMRRGIIPHDGYLDDTTIDQLSGFDFVFVCVDKSAVRKLVSDFLHQKKISFIDVGMELELIEEQQCLIGTSRTTLSTPDKFDHFPRHVSLNENGADDLYRRNIQVADLNAMNAAMAVIKWKKYCNYYQDCYNEHQSAYAINAHQLTRDEMVGV
jgi:ThiF family